MLEHRLDTVRGIVYLHPQGALAGIIIDAPKFPGWDSLGAMAAHIRIVREHHKRVGKIAAVTDAKLGDFAEKFASHFVAATVRHFPAGQVATAERWILGKT